jgi:hypothetical protein
MKIALIWPLILSLVLLSCGERQHIDPAFEPLETTQQTFRFSYSRSDEFLSPTSEFDVIGPIGDVLRGLADALVDIMLEEQNEDVPLEPEIFYLPDLSGVSLKMVDAVRLERVFISLKDQKGPGKGSLGFIKQAKVFIKPGFLPPPDLTGALGEEFERDIYDDSRLDQPIVVGPDVPRDANLILSYQRGRERLACRGKCMDMRIHPIDFLDFVKKGYTSVTLYFQLTIDAIPKDKLELETRFDISVDADLFK